MTLQTRAFLGQGFEVNVPAKWEDRSIYTFRPRDADGMVSGLWIVPDANPGVKTSEDYFQLRDRARLEGLPARRVLNRQRVPLEQGVEGWMGEYSIHSPSGEARIERLFCANFGASAFTLSCDFSSKGRRVLGPAVLRSMSSLRPRNGASIASDRKDKAKCLLYDGFRVTLEGEWWDATSYVVAQPCDGGFRENVLIQLDPFNSMVAADSSMDEFVQSAEADMVPPGSGAVLLHSEACRVKDGRSAWILACRRPGGASASVLQVGLLALRGDNRFSMIATLADRESDSVISSWFEVLKKFRTEED